MALMRTVPPWASWVVAVLLSAGLAASCSCAASAIVTNGRVDVGGHSLYIVCRGEGVPAVILDTGLGVPGEDWSAIQHGIADHTRACWYDRVGLGQSDEYPTDMYTTQDTVDDLHALLRNANIPGPYLLVSHSLAGFTARVYASQYPEEVVGTVWVDVSHPDQVARMLALLPPASPDEPESVSEYRAYLGGGYLELATGGPEFIDYDASAEQVRAAGSLGSIPLAVLTAGACQWPDDFPPELGDGLCHEKVQLQEELAMLSANGTHIVVDTSNHFIHHAEPDMVTGAILNVLAEARAE
jgi:pimeloyl-ACP methyl ester carboxylesterase